MENMERSRGRFERSSETIELQRSPEQVFDSDRGKAESEAIELQRILSRVESLHKRGEGVEIHIDKRSPETQLGGSAKPIKIVWCNAFRDEGTMLQLDPVVEGQGIESGIFGYKGRYGTARRSGNSFEFDSHKEPITLEDLFGFPPGTVLRVKPTIQRWAIGKDELSMAGGINEQTLYLGLGFLFLSPKWMYIGFHEAGHFPEEADENLAWTAGKKNHAQIYRDNPKLRKAIAKGQSHGLFGVLEKPYGRKALTVGRIERYGLTSHYLAGNAHLPEPWKKGGRREGFAVDEIMREFKGKIEDAQEAFDHFFPGLK